MGHKHNEPMNVDFLIIGQGIAGSTLALHLVDRGKSVLVVDRQDSGSSTRVAAGLVTPLTGKGMNPAWQQERCLAEAGHFYHKLEKESGRKFFHSQPVVRLFSDEKQRQKWEGKKEEMSAWAKPVEDLSIETPHGAIQMDAGAWLDTKVFLREVAERLQSLDAWRKDDFSEDDVTFDSEGVHWKDVVAEKIILCLGAYGLGKGGWFGNVPHRSAKGEVLTIWLDGVDEGMRYHANGWIAPRGGGVWKAGANYNWDQLDSTPTEKGKEEILTKLSAWVTTPIEVIGHEAAPIEVIGHEAGVRPIIRNSQPVVGLHPDRPQVGFFNGLGSKGTLMAPAVADHFADFLCGDAEIHPDLAFEF